MFGGKRTTLGDTLRLQFRHRKLRCEVRGPSPSDGHYWLKFFLFPSDTEVPGKLDVVDELFEDMRRDLEEHGIRVTSMSGAFDAAEKSYVIHAAFDLRDIMAAHQFQFSFAQPGRERS